MKKALVLSGGGCKGAYQVGVLDYLINKKNKAYDIYCGVSVGAINASFMSMYKNETDAILKLKDFWLKISTKDVYKRWFPFGRLHALWNNSLYNSQPLIDLIHKSLNLESIRANGRDVCVGAVSLDTGEYRLFSQKDDCFVDGVLASSAFPGGLRPIKIDNQLWTDGGVKHITPLKAAIQLGADEVDMILCSPKSTTSYFDNKSNAISLALRTVDLMTDQITESDIQLANLYNDLVISGCRPDKRFVKINIIRPNSNLTEDSLAFDHDLIEYMVSIGYLDASEQYV